MEKQKLIIIPSLVVFAISLSVAFSSRGIDSLLDNYSAKADTSITINNEALAKAKYEPFEVIDNRYDNPEVKQDKKFLAAHQIGDKSY